MEASKAADMSCKPLTLVAQPSEFSQLDLAQGRPTTEEKRHALVTIEPRSAKLGVVEHGKVPWKVLDHLGRDLAATHAPAPYGTLAGLLPSSPNHFRILADKLRVTCIGTSLPPPSAQWPGGQRGKRGYVNHHASCTPSAMSPSCLLRVTARTRARARRRLTCGWTRRWSSATSLVLGQRSGMTP